MGIEFPTWLRASGLSSNATLPESLGSRLPSAKAMQRLAQHLGDDPGSGQAPEDLALAALAQPHIIETSIDILKPVWTHYRGSYRAGGTGPVFSCRDRV